MQGLEALEAAHAATLRREELLDATERISRTGGWSWDVRAGAITWTDETYRIHGFDKDAFPADTTEHIERSLECYEPEDRARIWDAFTRCKERGEPYDLRCRFTDAGGRSMWIRTAGRAVLEEGSVVRVLGTIADITDVVQAERSGRESAARYVELMERTTDGVAVYEARDDGEDFVFVDLNPAGERLSDVTREAVLGRSILEMFPGARAIGLFDALQRVWRTGQPEYLPAVPYKDRRIMQWVANWVYRLPSGEVAAVYQDVTETRAAAARIRDFSRQLLAAREAERKSLGTALHHDLGSLTVGASALLDAIEDGLDAGRLQDARESLAACRGVLGAAVSRLKNVARTCHPPDLDLLGLPAALRQLFSRVVPGDLPRIRFRDATDGCRLDEAAAIALFRAGQEAVNNVLRHANATRVHVRLTALKTLVRLTVRDNGDGFDTEASPPEGSMGLPSIREMALSLGGAAVIESRPGRRTPVTLTQPRTRTP